jgi:hypothetical protein
VSWSHQFYQGILTKGGRFNTDDLHIKVACFARKIKIKYSIDKAADLN